MTGNIIVLTGPKHAGKTSAGKALAGLGGSRFIDLDALVESRTGKTPRELFREGPHVFRKAEVESLEAVLVEHAPDEGDIVLAAGGGLIDNHRAVGLLKKNGRAFVAYLSITAATAWRRIAAAGELPPFLNTENPEETHRVLHERRGEGYRKMAEIIVDCENKSPEEIAREIMGGFLKRER
jgi:shikimate kinase